nr:uncharacterized protein LOC120347612 isoform X2 [Styela clava]
MNKILFLVLLIVVCIALANCKPKKIRKTCTDMEKRGRCTRNLDPACVIKKKRGKIEKIDLNNPCQYCQVKHKFKYFKGKCDTIDG